MGKQRVVVFGDDGAKILINPAIIPHGALVDPDLSLVQRVPPHMWCLEDGKVVPKKHEHKPKKKNRFKRFLVHYAPFHIGFALGSLAMWVAMNA